MAHLSLVKSLSHLKEEQRHVAEVVLEWLGLALTRGTVAEISGGPSTGKTSVVISLLAKLTATGEVCAVVDATGGFDPCTAFQGGVQLENLLWVKCGGEIEKAFLSADYLVQAKGFGCIWLDLCNLPERQLRMVPKTYWYRYRTRIKDTSTLLVVTSPEPVTGSASHHALNFSRYCTAWSGTGTFKLLSGLRTRIYSRREFWGQPLEGNMEANYSEI